MPVKKGLDSVQCRSSLWWNFEKASCDAFPQDHDIFQFIHDGVENAITPGDLRANSAISNRRSSSDPRFAKSKDPSDSAEEYHISWLLRNWGDTCFGIGRRNPVWVYKLHDILTATSRSLAATSSLFSRPSHSTTIIISQLII